VLVSYHRLALVNTGLLVVLLLLALLCTTRSDTVQPHEILSAAWKPLPIGTNASSRQQPSSGQSDAILNQMQTLNQSIAALHQEVAAVQLAVTRADTNSAVGTCCGDGPGATWYMEGHPLYDP
jgi:hypothetical protein